MTAKEVDTVVEVLSRLTGASFVVADSSDIQAKLPRPKWVVRCTDMRQGRRIPYVNEAWKQKDGSLWLASLPLGDTIDWIEVAYGEEAAARSLDVNYSDFGKKEFQSEFGREYPLVYQRILTYAEIATHVSKARNVNLELRNSGSKGIVVFSFASKIKVSDSSPLEKKIGRSVEALKEAYTQAMEI